MATKLAKNITILLVALAVVAPAGAATSKAQRLLQAINRARAAHDLHPLRLDSKLSRFAHRHSQTMARTHALEHTASLRALVRRPVVGENLAWFPSDSPETIVDAWLASPPHRANLLSVRFTSVGLGDVGGLVTADFAG